MKKHTDLDGVKQVASALLFTDIEKTKYSPMVVQHPFTNTGVTAISVEGSFRLLNLLENPEDLNIWRQSMRQQIDNAETPYQIYSLGQAQGGSAQDGYLTQKKAAGIPAAFSD